MVGIPGEEIETRQSEAADYQRLIGAPQEIAQFILDPNGEIVEWPSGAQDVYGFDENEVLGQSLEYLYAEGKDQPSPETLLTEAEQDSITRQNWQERADGDVFWARFSVSPLTSDSLQRYVVASQDITAQKQYEQMLERQNDRLKEFTDMLAHDLQSPLSVLDGRIELYRQTGEDAHLDSIQETTERMKRLVEDLLRVSRQGRVVQDPEPTELESLIETAMEGTLPAGANIEYESMPEVLADRDRLIEVFENLFQNSVTHGGEDVTIRIGPLQNGFYIEDDGPGIPEKDHGSVFQHGFSTREDGTGYGLSVVQSIIGAHDWDIEVTAAADGGARFEVTGLEFVSE